MSAENNNKFKLRFFEIVISVCLVGVSALITWNSKSILELDRQMVAVNSSRFTSEHGLQVWREMASIREAIAKLPREFPPSDYAKLVDQRFAGIESRVSKMESAIDKLTVILQDNRTDIVAIRMVVEELHHKKP